MYVGFFSSSLFSLFFFCVSFFLLDGITVLAYNNIVPRVRDTVYIYILCVGDARSIEFPEEIRPKTKDMQCACSTFCYTHEREKEKEKKLCLH